MSDAQLLTLVIPNFNRREDVLEVLDSVYQQQDQAFEVIVVDDHSSDGSVEAIQEKFPQVRVIAQAENQGPAVARNVGIRHAKGDVIIGVDSDVILADKRLLKKISDTFCQISGLNCLAFRVHNYYDAKDDVKTWWHSRPIESSADQVFYTDYFSGTGYAMRKEVLDKVGGYPEDIFMHTEENDLAIRLLDGGYDIIYCPLMVVVHKVSSQARNDNIEFYYKRRNQIVFAAKYYSFFRAMFYLVPRLIKTLIHACRCQKFGLYRQAVVSGMGRWSLLRKDYPRLNKGTFAKIKLIRSGCYGQTGESYEILKKLGDKIVG